MKRIIKIEKKEKRKMKKRIRKQRRKIRKRKQKKKNRAILKIKTFKKINLNESLLKLSVLNN